MEVRRINTNNVGLFVTLIIAANEEAIFLLMIVMKLSILASNSNMRVMALMWQAR